MSVNKYTEEAEKRLKEFYSKKKRISYPKEEILITPMPAKNLDKIFYIEKGRVIEYDVNSRGDKVILNVFKEGSFFPMNHALAKTDIKYYFETDSEVMVRETTPNEIINFIESNSVVLFDLMTRVSVGIEGVLERLKFSLSGNLESKILAELFLTSERFGYTEGENGTRTLKQELSVTRISELIGASREATSRSVTKLIKEGKISRQKKIYTIN